jgi:hypothetical protein
MAYDKFGISLEDFNGKMGREDAIKSTNMLLGNTHGFNNDNGIQSVKFATSNGIIIKSAIFSYHNTQIF